MTAEPLTIVDILAPTTKQDTVSAVRALLNLIDTCSLPAPTEISCARGKVLVHVQGRPDLLAWLDAVTVTDQAATYRKHPSATWEHTTYFTSAPLALEISHCEAVQTHPVVTDRMGCTWREARGEVGIWFHSCGRDCPVLDGTKTGSARSWADLGAEFGPVRPVQA